MTTEAKTKFCGECNWNLPFRMFYDNGATEDGLSTYCKRCSNRKNRPFRRYSEKECRPTGYMTKAEIQEINVGCKIGEELIYKPKSKTRLLVENRKKRGPYLRCLRKKQRKKQLAREEAAIGLPYGVPLQNDLIAAAGNTRICPGCKQELPLWPEYFYREGAYGHKKRCKDCLKATAKAARPPKLTHAEYWAEVQRKECEAIFKEKLRIAARDAKYAGIGIIIAGVKMQTMIKVCSNCTVQYPATADYFHRCKRTKDGFANNCKKCLKRAKK